MVQILQKTIKKPLFSQNIEGLLATEDKKVFNSFQLVWLESAKYSVKNVCYFAYKKPYYKNQSIAGFVSDVNHGNKIE